MRQSLGRRFTGVLAQCIEREKKEGSRIGLGMPRSHGVGRALIANEHRVHRGAEEALDEECRRLIGADKVAQRPDYLAVAEAFTLTEQPGRSWREADALALQCVEGVDLALKRRVRFVSAEKVRTGR